ncbi:guanylate cyclase [Elysia marginata]|uniref:Guanylate cyclase n=1 Tax=Elysia marginata TaxID=1093978 RepID=A0AAV4H404_9GAST|nr:guanylate cyclase [Elysia marginata]
MDNVPCDPPNAFDEMMDIFTLKQHQSINAFVGPSCDDVCQPGGRLARYYDVMMISYGCESSIFDDKEEYPTFGRTTTTFKDMEVFFAEVISHFEWPRVTLVTMATPVWQETTTEFEDEISKLGVSVSRLTIESAALIPSTEFLERLLSVSQNTRVYILLMYPEAVLDFMRQSEKAGLTATQAENVFMVVDFAGSHHKMGLGTGPVSFLEGVLDITYDVKPESQGFKNFFSEILRMSQLTLNPNCSNYEYGIHSMLVSDGIYVVAGAFNASLSQNISVEEGAAIASTTRGATFQVDQTATWSSVAQLLGRRTCDPAVAGSIPNHDACCNRLGKAIYPHFPQSTHL